MGVIFPAVNIGLQAITYIPECFALVNMKCSQLVGDRALVATKQETGARNRVSIRVVG
ncbi:hypothetical protein [Planktothricoides raciborskii]|uniref:Uncharacterized protein n=1 Tax=Planktothricoides raciborskii FACHB-1370 TaxID=2949576 RepID=A0ABR8EAF3_9CYAN|nr:hypothetical protein [Planktothricoides raciborskii]MBD2543693.1 hypothetical protein [Planktothricoides raciborskii FACHB-1370]MBD2582414.1 hypothetical protein [Planktothricoides raciborskii FACHB-1261]